MKAAFFGTPSFAVPTLEALHRMADVALVVSQPDKPVGRGQKIAQTPVKERALALGLRVEQPTKVRTPEFAERLRALNLDVAVVVAYGRILPLAVLEAPKMGCVNVHASLLPRFRGAAPIAWAIAAGDPETGVCLMRMDEGLDTGPVISTERVPIGANETAADLSMILSKRGAELLKRDLPGYVHGSLLAAPQPAEGATYAPLLKKEDGHVDWQKPAQEIHNLVRGMFPWPSAYTFLEGERVKIRRTEVATHEGVHEAPGTQIDAHKRLLIACGQGVLSILELQRPSGKVITAEQFLAGRHGKTLRFSKEAP